MKSAQFGCHTWLADAMEGPTPVSALIHAATMVTAGILVLVKFSSLLILHTPCLNFLIILGSVTSLVGAVVASYQYDFKKIVAYSTCSQLGYMFLALGLGIPGLALMHLLIHALFKAQLFLVSGYIIHEDCEQDLRGKFQASGRLDGSAWEAGAGLLFSMSCSMFSLIGLVGSGGYASKDFIIEQSWFVKTNVAFFGFIISFCAAIFTLIYSVRLLSFVGGTLGWLDRVAYPRVLNQRSTTLRYKLFGLNVWVIVNRARCWLE